MSLGQGVLQVRISCWLKFGSGLLGLTLLTQAEVRAQDCPHYNHAPTVKPPRTVCDAGHPFIVKDHAMRTDARNHFGYYVGGGSVFGGRDRCATEGTWGWDYSGFGSAALNWTRGRYQGGGGTYRVETSHPVHTIRDSLLHRD